MNIWHDNSGNGNEASWFLKFIIVHDLQNREIFYFICNKWFAFDKEDGLTNRLLAVSGEKQKTEFKYLLEKETKGKISDGHLWFSIYGKPLISNFSRLDRTTCGFVLLNLSMLISILYYEENKSNESNSDSIQVGPIKITPQQVFRKFEFSSFMSNFQNH
jgi:hypothetical protein